jgi:hypothetical protein
MTSLTKEQEIRAIALHEANLTTRTIVEQSRASVSASDVLTLASRYARYITSGDTY